MAAQTVETTGCQYPASHHSDDLVAVWHGSPEPLMICGYHESRVPLTALVARVDPDDSRPHVLRRADELTTGDVILPWYAGDPWGDRAVAEVSVDWRATLGPSPRKRIRVVDECGQVSDLDPADARKVAVS